MCESFKVLAPILSEIWIIIQSDFWSSPDRQTDYRQTESDAYEPTVQSAQVGSKKYFPASWQASWAMLQKYQLASYLG